MAKDSKLTVSLILNDAAFSKQLQSVNKDLKLTESEFAKASSATENFDKSMQGLQTKLSSVTSKLESQSQKVGLYKSEIEKTKTTLDELTEKYNKQQDKLTSLNSKYQQTIETYGQNSKEAKELKSEIDSLELSQTKLETRILSTDGRLKNLNTSLNDSEAQFNKYQAEINKTEKAINSFNLEKVISQVNAASEKLKDHGEKLQKVGNSVKDVGEGFSKYVTVPIVALGTAAAGVSISFERSMSFVKATAGVTADELQQLTVKSREMGAATSKSATDAADAMGYMALAGWNTREMLEGIEPILRLSEAGQFDLAKASELVTDSMGGLKLQVKDLPRYLDQVAVTANKTNTDIQPLMEALVNVGSTATTIGVPLEEINAQLGILANNGTKGYEAGTKLNSIITRMTAQSGPAAEAWGDIGVNVFDAQGKFRGLTVVLEEANKNMKAFTDEQKMEFLKKAIGTDNVAAFTIMMQNASGAVQQLTSEVKNSNGTLMEMATVMQDNVKGQFAEFESKAEEAGLKIGETLLPILSDVLDKVMYMIDRFNELPKPVQENIVKFGLLAAAIGPVIVGFGNLITAGGSLLKFGGGLVSFLGKKGAAGAAATLTEAVAGTAGALATTTTAAGAATGAATGLGSAILGGAAAFLPWVAGAAAVGVAGYAIYKTLNEEVIPEVDLFADKIETTAKVTSENSNYMAQQVETNVVKISDATKKAVGSYMELDEQASTSLYNLYVNSTKLTADTASSLVAQYGQMNTQIQSKMDERYNSTLNTMSEFYATSNALNEGQEQASLEKLKSDNETRKMEIQSYTQQILSILQEASNNNRELTQKEQETINTIQAKMRDKAISTLSESEVESRVILERVKSNAERLTADQASAEIKNANEARDKTVDAATEKYVRTVAEIEKMRDETHSISKNQADKLIEEAERQKNETVNKAKDLRQEVVDKIFSMNKDVQRDVDASSGNIVKAWEKLFGKWDKWTPKSKDFSYSVSQRPSSSRMTGAQEYALPQGYSIQSPSIVDSFEVPNVTSYANDTVTSLAAKQSSSEIGSDVVFTMMASSLKETQRQNEILMQLVSIMQSASTASFSFNVEGKTIAKASAKYMKTELDNLNNRKSRLGGLY